MGTLLTFPARTRLMSLLFLCLLVLAPIVYAQYQYPDEKSALLTFQKTIGNAQTAEGIQVSSTWNRADQNACGWAGVFCTSNYTVAELDLSGWGLGGSFIPDQLSGLRDLSQLDLSSNKLVLNDTVLDVSPLTGLVRLDLSQNLLAGKLSPSISACQRLRFLSLERNQLDGAIPSSLGDLKNLQYLFLDHNQFSGPLSTFLTGLSSVEIIDLSYNAFNGSIPALPELYTLLGLYLDSNNFTGFENAWFSTVSQSLQFLSVSFNQLEGSLPSSIYLPNVQLFNMSGNRLSGNLPIILSGIPPVFSAYPTEVNVYLDLSQNRLTGEVPNLPDTYRTSPQCVFLNFSHNLLSGNLQIDFGVCIFCLDISHNNLSSLAYNAINSSGASFLETLRLGNNQLSGDAVDILISTGEIGVEDFRLDNNLLTGDLSRLIATDDTLWERLQVVDLSNNFLQWSISDEIPDPIALTLQKLVPLEFRVGGNNFSGTSLPTECFLSQSVAISRLHNPRFYFPMSSFQFQVLDLSDCHLKGTMSSAVFNGACLPNTQYLNLSNNDISGGVPYSILDIPSLEVLDLSSNHLTGQLPMLPYNGTLNNPSFFEGNDGLCGYPLPSCPQPRQGIQWWVVMIIVGACVILPLGSCLVATWRWRVYHKRHQQDVDLIRTLLEGEAATIMPLRELKKATHNFAESAQIGEGGFGTVYIGKLNNGTMVAIKRSKQEGSERDKQQFLNEVRILSQVNHRNLVKLLGCCMENKIALLVFEYIPNGTLGEHLSGKFEEVCLSWNQRVQIALQIADALNYLHSATVTPIYHRDVKSSNILLDENLSAKVGDFGISKLAPLKATHVSTLAVQGTIGYIDPEYYTSLQLTDKSDVYSFGVVLLELISAKPALDFQRGGDETSLVNFASSCTIRGDWVELIDPFLVETYNDMDGNGRKSILALSKLAFKCVEIQSKARPSMNEVLKELQNLWCELTEGMSKHLESSIVEDDFEDLQHDSCVLHFSKDGSSFTLQIDGSANRR